ncbi:MAG: NlpC/P60 family protein [Chitinophagaceae bacterium]
MIKNFLPALSLIILLASCSAVKMSNTSANSNPSRRAVTETYTTKKETGSKDLRFLDDISVAPEGSVTSKASRNSKSSGPAESNSDISLYMNRSSNVEKASPLQFKYAVLLNTEVEELVDTKLLEEIDEWYGTRYRMGGTTKTGIDCSAFVQTVCLSAYALALPRTAREQYRDCDKISSTELKEGDLVFFNTTGGISHVGIYLRNNKFAHASSSQGVTVSDMFDPYYLKRFIGAGRIKSTLKSGS